MVFDPYFLVAEKPSSENLYRCKFSQFTIASRSIPSSVVWYWKISRGRKASSSEEKASSLSYEVVTNPCCGLAVIFCGFISHLIGRETINIPEIFSGVHGFMGKTVIMLLRKAIKSIMK